MNKLLKELKIKLPGIRRHECYECPGALYWSWGEIERIHKWEMKDKRIPVFDNDESRLQICKICGAERTLSPYLTQLWTDRFDILKYIQPKFVTQSKISWVDDDLWSRKVD